MSKGARQATVFVVDDDDAMRDSIQLLLESVHLNARTFACALDFMKHFEQKQEGCLLLDVRMPGMNGMELLEMLKSSGIGLPVIMITGHGDVPLAVRALKHGAFDFIQKPFNAQELLDRVHAALDLDRENNRRSSEVAQCRALFLALTDREKEVVDLVVAGNSSKMIARNLGISPKTVDVHRANVMRKLNIRSVAELVQLRLALPDA